MMSKSLLAAVVMQALCVAQTAPVIEPTTLGAAPNATQIAGKVIFSGQPDEAGIKEAAGRDVKVVINLRTADEMAQVKFDEQKLAADSGMSYLSVPMQQSAPSQADREKIFTLLDEAQKPGGKPVLLHCGTSNRVGFMWGLYQASRNKLTADEAVARAKAAGMKSPVLEKTLRESVAP